MRLIRSFVLAAVLCFPAIAGGAAVATERPDWVRQPQVPAVVVAGAGQSQLSGRVTRVSDGDSLHLLTESGRVTIRLSGIDAPERGQPWSRSARQALVALVSSREVTAQVTGTDRWGRTLARLEAGGRDVNLALVEGGHVWVYRGRTPDRALVRAEAAARSAGLGLWSLPEAQRQPPWEWRRETTPVAAGR